MRLTVWSCLLNLLHMKRWPPERVLSIRDEGGRVSCDSRTRGFRLRRMSCHSVSTGRESGAPTITSGRDAGAWYGNATSTSTATSRHEPTGRRLQRRAEGQHRLHRSEGPRPHSLRPRDRSSRRSWPSSEDRRVCRSPPHVIASPCAVFARGRRSVEPVATNQLESWVVEQADALVEREPSRHSSIGFPSFSRCRHFPSRSALKSAWSSIHRGLGRILGRGRGVGSRGERPRAHRARGREPFGHRRRVRQFFYSIAH